MMTHIEIWNKSLSIIKDNIEPAAYETWFAPIVPISYENDTLLLQVPTQFYYEFIEEKYLDLVARSLRRVTGSQTRLRYRVAYDKQDDRQRVEVSSQNVVIPKQVRAFANPFESAPVDNVDPRLKWEYNFEHFIEGESNRLARSAAMAIAEKPGQNPFNPLFLYGPSGVGKTHLVNAIGVAVKSENPNMRVLYLSANLFQLQFTEALRKSQINDFIHFYQTLDVLILDDVQEILGKKATQNAFFNIFNHLHQSGKQIVMTCDRMPAQLKDVEERLLTRFKWGLPAEIERPDLQLRKDILKHKVYKNGLDICEEVIDFIANNVTDNIRDLEGAIVSLLAQSTFQGKNIDLDLAATVVDNLVTVQPLALTIQQVTDAVCQYYHISETAIAAPSRKQEIVRARQVAMYLSKRLTPSSLGQIGKSMGNRNHATVSHALQTVQSLMESDRDFRQDVRSIERQLVN